MIPNTRVPVICLPYVEADKAVVKELLCDYDKGDLYVVSAIDKSIILNITKNIKDSIAALDPTISTIIIEGIGAMNISNLLNLFYQKAENMIEAVDLSSEQLSFIPIDDTIDNQSIVNTDHIVGIAGFSNGKNLDIAQKYNNSIRWISLDSIYNGLPSTIVDGLNTVPLLTPNNFNIYLSVGVQESINLTNITINIILPLTFDQYAKIRWLVITNNDTPTLVFATNITWQIIPDNPPYANSHQVYEFETWDKGVTWLGKVVRYSSYI